MRAPQVGEQGGEVEGRHQGRRASADVGHGLGLHRVQREEEGGNERGFLAEQASADAEEQHRIQRVERDVDDVEAERRRVEGPVEDVARLEHGTHAATGALEERAPRMDRRVIDDDVVVIELEGSAERREVREGRDGGQEQRSPGPGPDLAHRAGRKAKAWSRMPCAVHQRLGAWRRTSSTRTPLRSAIATTQLPARPVEPVLTPITPS